MVVNGSNVIEIEQSKAFNIEVLCQTVDGEVTNGKYCNEKPLNHQYNLEHILYVLNLTLQVFLDDGRLLQITAGVKVSSNRRTSIDGKQFEQDIIFTPLYVMALLPLLFICNRSHLGSHQAVIYPHDW